MDATIQTNTPQGSPILAYGEVCPPKFGSPRHWFGIVLACIVVLCSFFVAALFFSVPFPGQAVVLIGLHGKSSLTDPLPRIWQHTAETTSVPFVAGIVKQHGEWIPFTVTFRGFGNAGAWLQSAGPFVVRAETPITLEPTAIKDILSPIMKLGRHSATLLINGDNIDPAFSGTLRGTVDGTILTTDKGVATPSNISLGNGDVVANLNALPESWQFIRESLMDVGVALDEMPSSIAWTETTVTLPELDLVYDTGPSTGTILSLATLAGQFDTERIQLPDGTVAEDLRLPAHALTGTSTLRWDVSSSTSIWINGPEAHIQTGAIRPQTSRICPGTLLAQFSQHAIENVAERLNIPNDGLRTLQLVALDDRLVICWQ